MQYRRLHFALLLILSWVFSQPGVAQTATYHLHKEASTITAADDKLLTAGPDGASLAITTTLTSKAAGEYLIKEFETQTGDPNTAGVIPSGSTLTFNLFMRKTANTGTVFPRAKIRLNNATGTLFCTATGTTALTTTVRQADDQLHDHGQHCHDGQRSLLPVGGRESHRNLGHSVQRRTGRRRDAQRQF